MIDLHNETNERNVTTISMRMINLFLEICNFHVFRLPRLGKIV